MEFSIGEAEVARAKHPHELFLVNLIFNHVLLFIATVSAASLQFLVGIVPALSVGIIGYTLWRARAASDRDPPFVACHWRLAANRSLMFLGMWAVAAVAVGLLLLASGGDPGPQHYALGGVAFFPAMLTMLVLILMESEAMQQAQHGRLPKRGALVQCSGGRDPV